PRGIHTSFMTVAAPEVTDQAKFTLDGTRGATELGSDFFRGVARKLAKGDCLEFGFAQPFEQPLALLRQLGRKLRCQPRTGDLVKAPFRPVRVVQDCEFCLEYDGTAPTLLPVFAAAQADGLALRKRNE